MSVTETRNDHPSGMTESGTSMDPRLKRLRDLIQTKAILHGSFTLASGAKSAYYFDGKKVTHDPEGITLIGEIIEEIIHAAGAEAIGGRAVGANAIVTAVQMISMHKGRPIHGFFVRPEKKAHGTEEEIGGYLPIGKRVAVVDDVVTTGTSIREAINAVKQTDCQIVKVVVLVDRGAGGSRDLREQGYDVCALFTADSTGKLT